MVQVPVTNVLLRTQRISRQVKENTVSFSCQMAQVLVMKKSCLKPLCPSGVHIFNCTLAFDASVIMCAVSHCKYRTSAYIYGNMTSIVTLNTKVKNIVTLNLNCQLPHSGG
jgi:hypothetical protein